MPFTSETERCTAHSKAGKPCRYPVVPGTKVCRFHGGNAPQVREAGQRRLAMEEAREWATLNGRVNIEPAQALLELVSMKAAEVAYWERRIRDLSEDEYAWGVTKHEEGIDRGDRVDVTTRESRKNIYIDLLHIAQRDLANFAATALKAGVDQALVTIAQAQAVQIVEVLRAALSDSRVKTDVPAEVVILDALNRRGLTA